MKKIIELENKWKAYQYKKGIYYVFLFVLIIFFVCLFTLIKSQYNKMSVDTIAITNVTKQESSVSKKNIASNNSLKPKLIPKTNNLATVNFVCRKVIVDKLTVRSKANFNSKALGYYTLDSIFCADNKNINGLLKTPNGWVSANDKYSVRVNSNMFADFGFTKYNSKPIKVAFPASATEVAVLQKDDNTKKATLDSTLVQNEYVASKPIINITSEAITQDRDIELKKIDFNKNNNYDIAIKIAEYYFDAKDYKNAIKWALNASKAESYGKQKSRSWIIYSKSLYLSGNKDKAIEVLDKYASTVNIQDVKDILDDMKKGIISG